LTSQHPIQIWVCSFNHSLLTFHEQKFAHSCILSVCVSEWVFSTFINDCFQYHLFSVLVYLHQQSMLKNLWCILFFYRKKYFIVSDMTWHAAIFIFIFVALLLQLRTILHTLYNCLAHVGGLLWTLLSATGLFDCTWWNLSTFKFAIDVDTANLFSKEFCRTLHMSNIYSLSILTFFFPIFFVIFFLCVISELEWHIMILLSGNYLSWRFGRMDKGTSPLLILVYARILQNKLKLFNCMRYCVIICIFTFSPLTFQPWC